MPFPQLNEQKFYTEYTFHKEINFLILKVCFKSIRNAIPAPTAAALILGQVLSEKKQLKVSAHLTFNV